ncbi:MAG: hypothetical protein ACOCRO_03100 [Halanaerobiales bacterium]
MAGVTGFEPATMALDAIDGFEDRCVTVTPHPYEAASLAAIYLFYLQLLKPQSFLVYDNNGNLLLLPSL